MTDAPDGGTVRWLTLHASSNVELAILSNVCRKWREIVIDAILDQAEKSLMPTQADGYKGGDETAAVSVAVTGTNSGDGGGGGDTSSPPSSLLLLPSMVRYILSQERSTNNNIEEYCICWFHPDGIEFMKLPVDANDDDSDYAYDDDQFMMCAPGGGDYHNYRSHGDVDSPPQAFAPGGEQSYAGSEEDGKGARNSRRRSRSRSPSHLLDAVGSSGLSRGLMDPNARYVNCVYQWNGYKEAIEVLRPFGYSIDFVKKIISKAKSRAEEKKSAAIAGGTTAGAAAATTNTTKTNNSNLPLSNPYNQKSIAVRGSTYARPEGYCFCWENASAAAIANNNKSKTTTVDAAPATSTSTTTMINQRERSQMIRRRNRRRRELQREVLPRVLYSAPFKGPDQTNLQIGVRQPCIQFLNIDSSHAVRLFTPPFKPGPIPAPITVFCVGIATEDGCFFSGLRNRFECGHLYPESPRDNLIERSAICTCVDAAPAASSAAGDGVGSSSKPPPFSGGNACDDEDDDDDDNNDGSDGGKQCCGSVDSDASSCDMSLHASGSDPGLKCRCPFTGLGNMVDDNDDVEDDYESDNKLVQTCRGARGPGLWHCYVATYDGTNSSIRVDGVPEEVKCRTSNTTNTTNSISAAALFTACGLDGLTIGADHTFDMSLCFGNGSDGEGEGAMAELAIFKGALSTADIEAVESVLMKKHGIPSPSLSPTELSTQDRDIKLAHAMLSHPPRHVAFSSSLTRIPLRYLSRHRLVSWRQANVVTGESIQVQRIGSKFTSGDSSSEW